MKLKRIRAHGIDKQKDNDKNWERVSSMAGYNFRMCDILSALGIAQLDKIDRMNDLRREHAKYLNEKLCDVDEIHIPEEVKGCKSVYQMYTIKVSRKIDKAKFILKLREMGIEASSHFDPPVHCQPYYKEKFGFTYLPITNNVSSRIVTLPMYPQLTKKELKYIFKSVKKIIKEIK